MKFASSQVAWFLHSRSTQRNLGFLLRFIAILAGMITVYSTVFHFIIMYEVSLGVRDSGESWITGFYWTLVVMTTLGFGDITFVTDLGRLFSIIVLLSGVVFLLILLPFTFIQFFYAPWVEAQNAVRTPRELASSVKGHVILTHDDVVTRTLIRKLEQYHYDYVLLVEDVTEALRLFDEGLRIVVGNRDSPETYKRLQTHQAALVATTINDAVNTNIAFTVREVAETVPIVATAHEPASVEILTLAGCNHVIELHEMLGQSLARRTRGPDSLVHEIGRFAELIIAEALITDTVLEGQTLQASNLRETVGLTVVGLWEEGRFVLAQPESIMTANTVLVLAGSRTQFDSFNAQYLSSSSYSGSIIIIGGGRVGRATQRALNERGLKSMIVERNPALVREGQSAVIGNAAEFEVLQQAGIEQAETVILTTHDDDINIYLTLYCRRLRPDLQIISRATQERNIQTLHRAGANLIMSYASMGANTIFNLLQRGDILMIAEGLNIFRVPVPGELVGLSLIHAKIRSVTGCNVIALQTPDGVRISPHPAAPLRAEDDLILIGDVASEERFLSHFEITSRERS